MLSLGCILISDLHKCCHWSVHIFTSRYDFTLLGSAFLHRSCSCMRYSIPVLHRSHIKNIIIVLKNCHINFCGFHCTQITFNNETFVTGFGKTRQLRTKIIAYLEKRNWLIQVSIEGLKLQACNFPHSYSYLWSIRLSSLQCIRS